MSGGTILDTDAQRSILHWAAERGVMITLSLLGEGGWCNLRSQLIRLDSEQSLLQILYPIGCGDAPPSEIATGDEFGVAFRRGHKKCIFVSKVVLRRSDRTADGETVDTLLIQVPHQICELQRRVYQRANVPPDRFIAVKVWQGGVPSPSKPSWPLCAGRIGNISAGGALVDIRSDQNPRLSVGDIVGLEITTTQGRKPMLIDAQYRHCTVTEPGRIGLGMQFLGLEHERPDRAAITEVADFVKSVQRANVHYGRSRRH